jgi:glutathione S-transferase
MPRRRQMKLNGIDLMQLFGSVTSPYVRKVRIALHEKGLPYEFMPVRASDPNAGIARLNPLRKVPVLVRDDGRALYDSPVIVEYIDGLSDTARLIPGNFADRIEVKRWEALGDGIADAAVALSHIEGQKPEWYAEQQLKIDRSLAVMEHDLGDGQFCHGENFTLADIATGFALGYVDSVLPKFDWRRAQPRLGALLERLASRDSFQVTARPSA